MKTKKTKLPSAWEIYQFLQNRHGSKFHDELYQWFAADAKTLSYKHAGTFRLLTKPEDYARLIMAQIHENIKNGKFFDWKQWIENHSIKND